MAAIPNDQVHSARAIISYPPVEGRKWQLEDVTFKEIRDDELLVQMVATGICHTDLAVGSIAPMAGPVPRVLGHEGQCLQLWWQLQQSRGETITEAFQVLATSKKSAPKSAWRK